MTLKIQDRVVECLRVQGGTRLKARDIAEWIAAHYPAECEEKKRKSAALSTDADLIQQIVAEIGANRPMMQRK